MHSTTCTKLSVLELPGIAGNPLESYRMAVSLCVALDRNDADARPTGCGAEPREIFLPFLLQNRPFSKEIVTFRTRVVTVVTRRSEWESWLLWGPAMSFVKVEPKG